MSAAQTSTNAPMFCRGCGKPLSDAERATAGNVYCATCAPTEAGPSQASAAGSSYGPPGGGAYGASYGPSAYSAPSYGAAGGPSPIPPSQPGRPVPGLAFALGLIPGVGAIYNGQYVKGLVHAVLFGTLAAASDNAGQSDSLFGVLMVAFIFYMAFEAFHTAQQRLVGQSVDEFSSILPRRAGGFPVVPVLLIALGIVFLVSNLGWLRFDWLVRFWPVGLIALGVYLLYERMRGGAHDGGPFDGGPKPPQPPNNAWPMPGATVSGPPAPSSPAPTAKQIEGGH